MLSIPIGPGNFELAKVRKNKEEITGSFDSICESKTGKIRNNKNTAQRLGYEGAQNILTPG